MFWQITSFPRCEYHAFLSHCAADRQELVHPIYDELRRRGIVPWLDREDYYYGRDSRTSLRDGLLRSRHCVFFVTAAMMAYTRGWCPMELAYADLLQANLLYPGGPLLDYELPLFFLDPADPEIPRTAWASLRDRGRFHEPAAGDPVAWSVEQIAAFLHREQRLSLDAAHVVRPPRPIHADLAARPGLVERVVQFDPGPIA